ncbi:MAG: hypothetical protein KDM64_10965, partial [Verrucomicrobiae bacterium]|nr:hypothetical protein [Verrucomicrobiae bacterium]
FAGNATAEIDSATGDLLVRNTPDELRRLNENLGIALPAAKPAEVTAGGTIATAGRTFTMESEAVDKVPALGDVPVVGQLFDKEKGFSISAGEETRFGRPQHEWQFHPNQRPGEELVDSESGETMVLGELFSKVPEVVGGGRFVAQNDSGGIRSSGSIGGRGSIELSQNGSLGLDGLIPNPDQQPLPSVFFENLPLSEAVELLETKANEAAASGGQAQTQPQSDANGQANQGGFASGRPVLLALDADGETAGKRVSLNLQNATLAEALAKVTQDTGTEYRVTASGIVIAQPSAIPAEKLVTMVMELPNAAFETPDGKGGVRRLSARGVLTDAGIEFPRGTSAAYNFTTRRLAVRHLPESLESVKTHFAAYLPESAPVATPFAAYAGGALQGETEGQLKGFDRRNAGLIPIDFALPESGRSYVFSGLYAPEPIRFRYVNWDRQIRFAWVWMLVGGLAFWFGAARRLRRPVLIGLLGAIVLTFLPLIVSQSLLAFCNSLLLGWIAAAALWTLWRLSDRVSRLGQKASSEVPAPAESANELL